MCGIYKRSIHTCIPCGLFRKNWAVCHEKQKWQAGGRRDILQTVPEAGISCHGSKAVEKNTEGRGKQGKY